MDCSKVYNCLKNACDTHMDSPKAVTRLKLVIPSGENPYRLGFVDVTSGQPCLEHQSPEVVVPDGLQSHCAKNKNDSRDGDSYFSKCIYHSLIKRMARHFLHTLFIYVSCRCIL